MAENGAIVKDIRSMWSHAGVEVESVSGNKVRCRMPPYFQGVQEFTQSLEAYDAVVDLETSITAGTASVVFCVYAGETDNSDRQHQHYQQQDSHPRQGLSKDSVVVVLVLMCMILQIASMINWKETIKFIKRAFE